MEEYNLFNVENKIKCDIDFILLGKTKIKNHETQRTIDLISSKIAQYSHNIFKHGAYNQGLMGHLTRKNLRADLFKFARLYIRQKAKELK